MHVFSYLLIGVEVFVEMEYLGTEKIRWGGQGIIRASHRKDPVLIKSTILTTSVPRYPNLGPK